MAQYTEDAINYSQFRDLPGAVYTRSGVAYQQNASGTWVPFDENVPPISDGVGLGVWEARTNSIRNPTGLGAVVGVIGAGGALPTNWASAAQTGLTREIVGVGAENGLPYVDFKMSGTNSTGGQVQLSLDLEGPTQIVAAQGQTWTLPVWLALKQGALPSGTAELWEVERNSGGGLLAANGLNLKPLLSGALTRITQSVTLGNASTAFVSPTLRFNVTDGETYSFTLRVSAPNLKLGANINDPPILQTNNAAATRGAASAYINAPGLLVPPFTLFAQFNMPQPLASTYPRVLRAISDGGTDVCDIYIAPGRTPRAFVMTGGVTQADFGSRVVAEGAQTKVAVRFKTDSIAMSVNGLAVETDTSATLISQYSKLYYGTTGASGYFNGAIQRFQIINRDVTDAELQALTV